MAIPAHDVTPSRSPATRTPSNAAVNGSASDRVTAEEDGIFLKPVEKNKNKQYSSVAIPRYKIPIIPLLVISPSVGYKNKKGISISALIEKMTATDGTVSAFSSTSLLKMVIDRKHEPSSE